MSASAHVFDPFHADLTIDAAPGLFVCMRGNLRIILHGTICEKEKKDLYFL